MRRGPTVISKIWAQASLLTFLPGFTGLGILAVLIYARHAPIPARVVAPSGAVLFTRDDIRHPPDRLPRYTHVPLRNRYHKLPYGALAEGLTRPLPE